MKKTFAVLALLFFLSCSVFSAVTSVEIKYVGTTGQYIEAGTQNNPVLHFKINAPGGDTLSTVSVYNALNSWYVGAVQENSSISDNGIKVWYSTVETDDFSLSSPSYVTHLPRDISDGGWWYNSFSLPVADGSHIWITADIQNSPSFGTMEMQTDNLVFDNSSVTSADEPANPRVLLVTSVTPAGTLEVLHEPGSIQSTVSTTQGYVIPMELQLYNNSESTSADIKVSAMTLKIQSYPVPGTTLSPASIISSIRIQDKSQGTIYGELLPGTIPSAAAPFTIPLSQLNIPAGITTTVNAVITISSDLLSAGTEFVITLESGSGISAHDYYTQKQVPVNASPADTTGFAMHSKQSKIQKRIENISTWFTKILPEPQNINKGATNVELLKIGLENTGDTNTAAAEIYDIKLYVEDGAGAPIVPRDLFSKISITDESGIIKYRVKNSDAIEAYGNTINFPLTASISIASASAVTIVVKADISSSTIVNSFKIKVISGTDLACRDKNSFSPVYVSATVSPFYSSLALLSSSFTVSHSQLMPANIYKGQTNIKLMDLQMRSPLSFGNGNILVRGISLTAKGSDGLNLELSSVFSKITLNTSDQTVPFTIIPASSTGYFAFPYPVTIAAVTGETIAVFADIKNSASASSIQLLLSSDTAISAYQDNDPLRQIFITAAQPDSFPMSSGTGFIAGTSDSLSFSAYPVPFSASQPAVIGYYLAADAQVTITVYDLMGKLIKTVIKNSAKTAGSHSEDTWNGSGQNQKPCLAGAYIIKIDAGSLGTASAKVIFTK